MAFGQSPGPPATSKQLRELLELVNEAGHLDFRDARGPLGLTQRQAAGKFTRDEADDLIAQLQGQSAPDVPSTASTPATDVRDDGRLRHVPNEELAAELQRRGWVVLEP